MNLKQSLEYLRTVPAAFVTDAMRRIKISGYPRGIHLLHDKVEKTMVGCAVTLKYVPKQSGLQALPVPQFEAARSCKEDDILVFSAKGSKNWLTGGNVSRVAMLQGAKGLVVDGCIRDAVELKSRPSFPVYCTGTSCKPYAEDMQLVAMNEPVEFGGIMIYPGDIIVGDEDGLVVIPKDRLEDVIFQLEEIPDIEERLGEAVERKESLQVLAEISKEKQPPREKGTQK